MGHDHEGQRVSRRTALAGIGAVGLGALLAACGNEAGGTSTVTTSTGATASITPRTATSASTADLFADANTCVLTESTTQGPYYFDADKIRSDIREDRQGTRLKVAIKVQDSETCKPLPDAVVEIWHCDAGGIYSGAEALSSGQGGPGGGPGGGTPPSGGPGGPGGPTPGARPTGAPGQGGPSGGPGGGPGGGGANDGMGDLTPADDKRYLRGAQVTDSRGTVQFTTIWPGWYRGRTVHIHVMVHVGDARVLTTQLMFDESLNTKVFAAAPYSEHTGRDTLNDNDSIYRPAMLMKVTEDGDGHTGAIVLSADSDKNGK
ncbi:intradiol ring-cleavage dioxygenase [Streptosporangium sp. NPDC051022]|uniref:intradiol ring-cleavage dioxygenase n=1 Tax=Streptosporangium sp. NPDC051022 TaxID=3155752 RepID=UPI003423B37D